MGQVTSPGSDPAQPAAARIYDYLLGGNFPLRSIFCPWKLPRDRPAPCRGWPASGPARLPPGPCLLTGVPVEAPGQA